MQGLSDASHNLPVDYTFQVKAVPETSEFDRKLQTALAELEATGMWWANFDPHVDRGLRKLGLRVRPPHYRSFLSTMLEFGASFVIGFAIIAELAKPIDALAIGLIFGGGMALVYYRDRRKHSLSDWDTL